MQDANFLCFNDLLGSAEAYLTLVRSKFLDSLSQEEREKFKEELLGIQHGVCFICEEPIDLKLHKVDIDHVIPGLDQRNNFAITHEKCNREKQDLNLEVARAMKRFDKINEEVYAKTGKSPDISHILKKFGGSQYELPISFQGDKVRLTFQETGSSPVINELPIFTDELSGFKSFFASIPIEYVFRDEKDINPRTISDRVKGLIKEFYLKRPQLQVSLARINLANQHSSAKVFIFDGQHKAAAQILLGVRKVPMRIFINPDLEVLMQTNERAGTVLRQVAFDLSVRRQIGSTLLAWKIETFQRDKGLQGDDYSFSEKDLLVHFKGEAREVKRFILDYVRNEIINHKYNKLKDYIAFGGKEHDKPVSYSAVNRTFFSLLLSKDVIDVRPYFNPKRENEINNMVRLMSIVTEEVLPEYKFDIGSWKIEEAVRKEIEGKSSHHIPDGHLRALRMLKEEIMYNWIQHIKQIISNYFTMQGRIYDEGRILQETFDDVLWSHVKNYLRNLKQLPLWVNRQQSHIFTAKQTYDYWFNVFKTGEAPDGTKLLPEGINLIEMIKA